MCFIGPTGVGKSTAAALVRDIVAGAELVKVAAPLYEIQDLIYQRVGAMTNDRQDGELLQFLGEKFERDFPGFLAADFLRRLNELESNGVRVFVNDDARSPNTEVLRANGFVLVRISGPLRCRDDLTPVAADHPTETRVAAVQSDAVIDNTGSLADLRNKLLKTLEELDARATPLGGGG